MASSCEAEVWKQGHALLAIKLGDSSKDLIEELCKRMKSPTLLVDWHYCGGVPIILYLGTLEEARSSFEKQLEWFNKEHLAYMRQRWPKFEPHGGFSTLTMDDVTTSPTAKSIGQVWNADRKA